MNTPIDKGLAMPTEFLLTISQLSEFFTEHGVTTRCTQCSAEDWVLVEPPQNMIWSVSASRSDGSVVVPAPSIPVVALCCARCANLRQHALKPIQQWLNAKLGNAGISDE